MATNSKDIFDEISFTSEQESPKGDVFDELIYEKPLKRKAKIAGKALAKGVGGAYGDILDILHLQSKEQLPGEKAQREREFDTLEKMQQEGYKPSIYDFLALSDDDDIAPRYSRLPSSQEVGEMLGEEKPKDFVEEVLSRGGQAIGSGLALGGGLKTLGALLSGSIAGAGAKELGFPDEVADIVDIAGSLATGKGAQKLLGNKKQKALINALRKKGFTDKEITPLIQNQKKLKRLGKFAAKDEKVAERLSQIKNKIGDIYESVKETGKGLEGLSGTNLRSFEKSLGHVLSDIRKPYYRLISDELKDLHNSEHSLKDLIDFYQDISMKVKGVEGGRAILNKLKGPVVQAMRSISPEAAEDFELANKMYSKLFKTARILKLKQFDELMDLGKIYGVGAGLASGNLGVLTKVAGATGGRVLARELLINPKLQNFSKQIAYKIKNNKKAGIRNITQKALKYLKEERPDIYEELSLEEEK